MVKRPLYCFLMSSERLRSVPSSPAVRDAPTTPTRTEPRRCGLDAAVSPVLYAERLYHYLHERTWCIFSSRLLQNVWRFFTFSKSITILSNRSEAISGQLQMPSMRIHLEEPELRPPPGRQPQSDWKKKRPKSAPSTRPQYSALGLNARDQEKRRLQLKQVSQLLEQSFPRLSNFDDDEIQILIIPTVYTYR